MHPSAGARRKEIHFYDLPSMVYRVYIVLIDKMKLLDSSKKRAKLIITKENFIKLFGRHSAKI